MPFTPTHVIAVLPFWPARQWLPFPALAIGAMVPDFGLFFSVIDYAQLHRPVGVLTTCLPLGLVIFLVFETIIRRPVVLLLPDWIQFRLKPQAQIPVVPSLAAQASFYAGVGIALMLGATTHQVWDAFTHEGRWGTELFPSLKESVSVFGIDLPGYKLFQYGSTLIGLPILAAVASFALTRIEPREGVSARLPYSVRIAVATVFCAVPLVVALIVYDVELSYYQILGATIRRSGAIMLLLCLAFCVGIQVTCIASDYE